MNKKTVKDVSFQGKKALVRVDFNVPLADGVVQDDTRIRAALPTLNHILEDGGSLVLMSHLGRPKGGPDPKFSLKPAADRLSELIGKPVQFVSDCIGDEVKAAVDSLQPGGILLLENVRFHEAETAKDDSCREFAKQLAQWGDLFVNDAFGSAHRPHASVSGVTEFLQPSVAGFLLEKEIEYLVNATTDPERPFVAILGGAKVSDKIGVIKNLLPKVDALLIGGAMAYTFMASEGKDIGNSLVEEDKLDEASELLIDAEESKKNEMLIPVDHVVAEKLEANTPSEVVRDIPDGKMALDIGPKTREMYCEWIKKAKTVIWNGPMGVFETPPFHEGTEAVAKALADSDCMSIIGGGDSVSAINKLGFADKVTHISTGGGASLELLEGKELPGLTSLTDRD
ncbi:MAG: phosphoglycerate kinase [Candidatus Omnitrophica bacterium]|nr:phosphoglycerate kinase [Candidatus Omnitrophota bacterium]MCA9423548.1 phosphoglycerate kinase [Candidatus Omnitrophota bacterium]MCA9428916.1 phosphoglycerate kinase [Candidatus Omnitrophota bacterium]MCA9435064.1 phosphoglycerate kinase [Candidatus Omnitrophota bacterium]MCA9440664.1 phosphoglycerate kinase [Candidatus Omnitrophota bacterium]